jgi:Nif-specific regulatory protein
LPLGAADAPAAASALVQRAASVRGQGGALDASSHDPVSHSALLPVRPYRRVGSHPAQALVDALEQSGGNKSRAAQQLGMTPRQFTYRWQKLGLPND